MTVGSTSQPAQQMLAMAMQLCCDTIAQKAGRISDLLRSWDTDGNGLIDRKEVRAANAVEARHPFFHAPTSPPMRRGSSGGRLTPLARAPPCSPRQFRNACASMGFPFPRDVTDALFDYFDEEGDGNLDHKDLVLKARRGVVPAVALADALAGSAPRDLARVTPWTDGT